MFTQETFNMGIEASLDRAQAYLFKALNEDKPEYVLQAYSATKKLLGQTRSVMQYNKKRPQQTLIAYGFGRFNSHRKRLDV